jgi:hypothetical protein
MEIIDLTGDDEARVETTTKLEAREVLTETLSKVSAVWEKTENKPVVAALAFFSLVGLVALEGVLKGILVTSSRAVDKLVPSLLQLIGTGYIASDALGDLSDADVVVAETPEQHMGLVIQAQRAPVYSGDPEETDGDDMDPAGAYGDDDDEEEEEEEEEDAAVTESACSLEHHVEPDWDYAAWVADEREIDRQADSFQSYCDGQDY